MQNILVAHEDEKCMSHRFLKCVRQHNKLLHLSQVNNDNHSNTSNSNNQQITTAAYANANNTDRNIVPISVNAHAYRENKPSQVLLSKAEIILYDYLRKPILHNLLMDRV